MGEIIIIIIYSVVGFLLMLLGTYIVDLIIPCDFPKEIKAGNKAVGYIMASSSIATGILLKSVIAGPIQENSGSLVEGLLGTVIYFSIGIVLCIASYIATDKINGKYKLNDEIAKGNQAAGIMVGGIFIGLAILISGVIQ